MKKPTALGCQIYAGGFTLGVRRYFRVLAHLELNNYGVSTVARNLPRLPIHACTTKPRMTIITGTYF